MPVQRAEMLAPDPWPWSRRSWRMPSANRGSVARAWCACSSPAHRPGFARSCSPMRSSAVSLATPKRVQLGQRADQACCPPAGPPTCRRDLPRPSRAALRKAVQDGLLALRTAEQAAGAAVVHCRLRSRAAMSLPHTGAVARPCACTVRRGTYPRWRSTGKLLQQPRPTTSGDHITGAPHDHGVAHAHVLAAGFVFVVQRGVAHGGAAHEHRLQLGNRRELAGAAHLHVDVAHHGHLLLRGVLVRHRPARLAAHEAQALLQRAVVDLVDHAVDVEGQRVALGAHRLVEGDEAFGALHSSAVLAHRQAHGLQRVEQRAVRGRHAPALHVAQAVGEEAQGPLGGHGRVELAHRAGAALRGLTKVFSFFAPAAISARWRSFSASNWWRLM